MELTLQWLLEESELAGLKILTAESFHSSTFTSVPPKVATESTISNSLKQ